MNLFQRIFGPKEPPPQLDHPLFGKLTYSRQDGWINSDFSVFGYSGIELLISAGPEGPTSQQVDTFQNFSMKHETILTQCMKLLQNLQEEMNVPRGDFVLSGITIPSYKAERNGMLWTLWFDCPEEEHFWFGVQSDDEWQTLHPFADD